MKDLQKLYRILRIEEDIDFGCEERPENSPVRMQMERNGVYVWQTDFFMTVILMKEIL